MESNKVTTVQNINRRADGPTDLARKYLSIIFTLNNIHITKRKLDLLSYMSIYGINSITSKVNFCKQYKSSQATISNMISELYEEKILIKENGKVRITPSLSLNFNHPLTLKVDISL